jgi:hypothetical protein
MNRRFTLASLLCCFLVVGGILSGCDDDSTPPADTSGKVEAGSDMPTGDIVPWPDAAQPDKFIWPDQGEDQIVWPDAYSGTPFGCETDGDCFGQKCCPTPWGVKLCAPTCN